ncbi:MAG: DUF1015 domain-containing protein [Anaerolineaceae bacterium]|nr:DUF1015 domain-containing protein [Anaerolineaceae bacterium]
MKTFPDIGVQIPQILLPHAGLDLQKWAVIACDQFTSEPEYWENVCQLVGDAPSTYNLVLPEVYLGKPEEAARVNSTQHAMQKYVQDNLLVPNDGMILVERSVDGKTRRGLMLALDLECYDYNKGSQTLVRATEGTILDRLPPRMKIRQGALLELPHILVLIDDPERTVIEPILSVKDRLEPLYDFELMLGSGHLRGYRVNTADLEQQVIRALEKLADPQDFARRYDVGADKGVLLFAMGDGNHSLATAKAIWEKIKPQVGLNHPARYALVEIENVHDQGLDFEPIHRVLFELKEDFRTALQRFYGNNLQYETCQSEAEMVARVSKQAEHGQSVGVISAEGFGIATIVNPPTNLPVGSLQVFLDNLLKQAGAGKIDYVHGQDVVVRLGSQPGNVGFFLPAMPKHDLFKTVILDGALPRKTFSMGEAREKRFYMEARRIA